MRFVVLIGRILFSAIFIMSSFGHFSQQTIGYAAHQGVPFASILVPISGVFALLGGLMVLLGFQARIGALLLVLFLVPVTAMMHNFWTIKDPMMAQTQHIMFMKNITMLGGAFMLTYFGAGPLSIDDWLKNRAGRR